MRRISSIALLAMTIFAAPAVSQTVPFGGAENDTSAPVEVSADDMLVNQSTGQAQLTGSVLIAQGDMRLSADKVVVKYDPQDQSRIASMDATGNVTLVQGEDAAEAGQAIYDVSSGLVTLMGDVLVTQGENVMSGEKIVVNLEEGTAQASGRVRTILQPGSSQ
ncbi:lipopolysaccharide transport periplasmic protein LptA [Paracoccus albus]|uniref:lipopolysaccharide transport periplasmic protein LptA n=1 Tax=Paracoccus albus TaxID=3017784 RepID=UPI0022F0A161|nr:lipopolysaccharide transport periplasmic protein LptA [Paracoccus albus]WBU60119.1 lipopolysaccharide transport periplasmic protein LptA [Paracoccus albus]